VHTLSKLSLIERFSRQFAHFWCLKWLVLAAPWVVGIGESLAQASPSAAASSQVTAELESICLLIEPRDGPTVSKPIPGARSTVLVPGRETSLGGVRYYTAGEFGAMDLGWSGFRRKAAAAADRVFATLTPEVTKDAKGFVRFVVLRGKTQLTASTVLAPKFHETFRATMGDDLIVLIPDRFTVYVFPRPMGEYKQWGRKIIETYSDASYPVSLEVFLLSKAGLSGLGSFQTD
jgi:hypothetical protein